jgi:indolepyruvate ferredoxin oxidoreductase beta subunit
MSSSHAKDKAAGKSEDKATGKAALETTGKATTDIVDIIVYGLGGQGVLKASDIIADAAFRSGHDVKKTEVHGMSQRGGSVQSDVRFGARVSSPMVPPGEADFAVVLAAEETETARRSFGPGGILIGPERIPDGTLENRRTFNVAMIGALSTHLELPLESWQEAIRAALPEKLHEVNLKAFLVGRSRG